jgi:hypothetical protein
MVKQSNKQTTKVIVKIGTDVIKRKRTRRNKKVQPPPPQPPQNRPPQVSFGTLSSQNTSLNAFSSNIQSQLDNLLKSQSDLNTIVNKLRSEQRPEENEGQNAQIVSGLNLNSEEPIDYEEIIPKPFKFEIPPEPTDEEYEMMATDEEKQRVNDFYSNLQKEAEIAGNKSSSSSSTGRGRSRTRKDDPSPFSKYISEVAEPYQGVSFVGGPPVDPLAGFRIPRGGKKGRGGRPPKPELIDPNK